MLSAVLLSKSKIFNYTHTTKLTGGTIFQYTVAILIAIHRYHVERRVLLTVHLHLTYLKFQAIVFQILNYRRFLADSIIGDEFVTS